jgi:hypothetical protein
LILAAITGTPATAGMRKTRTSTTWSITAALTTKISGKLLAPGMQLQTTARMPATAKTQPAERTSATASIKATAAPVALSKVFYQNCLGIRIL